MVGNATNRKFKIFWKSVKSRWNYCIFIQTNYLKYFSFNRFFQIGNDKNADEFVFEEGDYSYDEIANEIPIQTYGPWPKLNLSEVLNESAINFDKSPEANFRRSWEEEIMDLTRPEIIDAAVNKKIDFNESAHKTSIGPDTANLSLIEAFDYRVSLEQEILKENIDDGRSFSEK